MGGIAGQLEPEVLQTFSEDFLDKLLAQLDTLQDIMDRTANHAGSISDSIHAQMNDLTGKVRDTKDIAKELTDAMTDWANGNIDEINDSPLGSLRRWTIWQTFWMTQAVHWTHWTLCWIRWKKFGRI